MRRRSPEVSTTQRRKPAAPPAFRQNLSLPPALRRRLALPPAVRQMFVLPPALRRVFVVPAIMRRKLVMVPMAATLLVGGTAEMGAPWLAENRMHDKLAAMGEVEHLEVRSDPSAKLLLGKPDEVDVELGRAEMGGESKPDSGMWKKALDVDRLRARIDEVTAGPMTLDGIAVDKNGDRLALEAAMMVDQIDQIMPGAKLSASEEGNLQVEMESLPMQMPMPGPITVEISAENGAIVAQPSGDMPMPMPPQTLFQREELSVEKFHAATDGGELVLDAEADVRA